MGIPDLHKLANTPGYGEADRALENAGHPREKATKTWTVEVEYSVAYTDTVEVEAASKRDAEVEAREMIEMYPGDGIREHVEVYTCEASE